MTKQGEFLSESENDDMDTVVKKEVVDSFEEGVPTDRLFVVWFDLNCGYEPHDWWWEIPGPQTLAAALDLAAELRANRWVCMVLPEGENPRPDGRWDNP